MAETKRFLLRLDPRLFEALRRWADDDLRSINAQIEYLLTEQARRAGRLPYERRRPQPPSSGPADSQPPEREPPGGEPPQARPPGKDGEAPSGRRRSPATVAGGDHRSRR